MAGNSGRLFLIGKIHLIDITSVLAGAFLFARGPAAVPFAGGCLCRLFSGCRAGRLLFGGSLFFCRDNKAFLRRSLTDPGAVIGIVGDHLRQDILCALKRILRGSHFLLSRDISGRFLQGRMIRRLGQDPVRKPLQAFLPGDTGAGPAFGTERPVQILNRHLGLRILDLGAQGRRQFPLGLDALDDLFLFVLEIAQIGQPLIQRAKLLIVQCPCRLLAVAGDKGDGIALVDQRDRRLHLPQLHLQLTGDHFRDLSVLIPALCLRGPFPFFLLFTGFLQFRLIILYHISVFPYSSSMSGRFRRILPLPAPQA